jgi:hypothetical protein
MFSHTPFEQPTDKWHCEGCQITQCKNETFGLTSWHVRGRLHVSESAYESPYDSVHDLYANRIGIQFFSVTHYNGLFTHFKQKKSKINLLDTFGSKSYTESYGDLYGQSHV